MPLQPPDGNCSHCMGQCSNILAKLSAAVDQNIKMTELLVNCTMPTQPCSLTIQDSDERAPMRKTKVFKTPARPTSRKDTGELHFQVRFILNFGLCRMNVVLQKAVHKHANTMMGRKRGDKVKPAPEEAVLKYKSTHKEEDGPSKDRFQPDFSERCPENSLWNLCLANIFENDYVTKGHPIHQVKDVSKYFLTYLRSLQSTHRKMVTTATTGSGTVHKEGSRRNRIEKHRKSVRLGPLLYGHTDTITRDLKTS